MGRSLAAPGARDAAVGRDHNIDALAMWLAGGGVTPGQTLGSSDKLGCFVAEDFLHIHDQ